MPFVHLHLHSYYSFCRGASSIEALLTRARQLGMRQLALTDTNGLYGLVNFLDAAREVGIEPIVGAELVATGERAVCLVRDREGYATLCRLISACHQRTAFRLAPALLTEHRGLVILSDCRTVLEQLRGRVPELFAELRWGAGAWRVARWAREQGVPPVATNAVHFAAPGEWERHRLLRAIDLNTTLSSLPAQEVTSRQAYLKDEAAMAQAFSFCPEALENAGRIAARCAADWFDRSLTFPAYRDGEGDPLEELRRRAYAGARQRYGSITPEVRERLEYELAIIAQKRFADYFLVVEDIVHQAPRTCGRGSGAASIVSYSLGITHVDPLRHRLFFERFLNPGRTDPPDIDIDFPWDERDAVLAYALTRYGAGRAAMVANHVCFQARAAVREVAKVFGVPAAEIREVTRRLSRWWGVDRLDPRALESHPLFRGLRLDGDWPRILALACQLEEFPRNLSVHCGGVVIVPDRLDRYVPVERAAKQLGEGGTEGGCCDAADDRRVPILQWEKDQTEEAGLVKIDLLGNRSLAVIRDALAAVAENTGVRIDFAAFNPIDDPATQQLIARGDTIGCFYIESPATRLLQQKSGRGDFEHVVIHSSIIRPAANTCIKEYLRRLKGGEWEPLHPLVEDILRDTYGIMVYQEDVTKVAMALAGFDAVEGDGLRKVLAKKNRAKRLADYREKFYAGARERGVAVPVIDRIWAMILSFSGYSFCKPHSASYALVSFKCAYLRAHHPAEFMAAVISNQGGYYATFAYLSECRRMGLTVLPPDINASDRAYRGRRQEVRVGLMQLKGFPRAAMQALLDDRRRRGPFASLDDLVRRIPLTLAEVRTLIKAGCLDSIAGGRTRPELLWRAHEWFHHHATGRGTLALFAPEPVDLPPVDDYSPTTVLRHEVETLDFLVSRHPLTLFAEQLRRLQWVPACDLGRYVGRRVTTIGWYVTAKVVHTAQHEPMEFVSFEDTTGIYETVLFPRAYRRFCHLISPVRPFVLQGVVEEEYGAITVTVDSVRYLERDGGARGAGQQRSA